MLLFGDDYQLTPVDNNGAINGYYKMCHGADEHVTDKMTDAQLFVHRGNWLFTEIMTDQVFSSQKNIVYSAKSSKDFWSVSEWEVLLRMTQKI